MKIFIESDFWEDETITNSFTQQNYFLLKYPKEPYSDYICKLPSDYVLTRNNKPYAVVVWDGFIFDFEIKEKRAGKRFKHLKLTINEIKSLFPSPIESMKLVIAAYPEYSFDRLTKISVVESLHISAFRTDGTWLYHVNDFSNRKRISAKGLVVLKDTTEDEVQLFYKLYNELIEYHSTLAKLEYEAKHRLEAYHIRCRLKSDDNVLDKYFAMELNIVDTIKNDLSDLKKSERCFSLEQALFKIAYDIDIKEYVDFLVSIKDLEENDQYYHKVYPIKQFKFPSIVLGNDTSWFFHQLKFIMKNRR